MTNSVTTKKEVCDVVIVEDNFQNRLLLEDILAINEFSVSSFEACEDALAFLKHNHTKIILLDISLPHMTGFEMLKIIKQTPKLNDIKVVAVTALALEEQIKKIKEEGFDAYFVKPLDIKVLVEKMKVWCK